MPRPPSPEVTARFFLASMLLHPFTLTLMRFERACFALLAAAVPALAADDYQPGPDSLPQPDVPAGTVSKYTFDQSKIFPGTARDYWVYVPKQYQATKASPVMLFQDGLLYQATNVFNNLIHKK